eukprot:scaffold12693_cov64-Cyclotella_meneghiniana.AAC.3
MEGVKDRWWCSNGIDEVAVLRSPNALDSFEVVLNTIGADVRFFHNQNPLTPSRMSKQPTAVLVAPIQPPSLAKQ